MVRTNPEVMVSEGPGTLTEMTSDVTTAETDNILMKMMRSTKEEVEEVAEATTTEEGVTEETLRTTEESTGEDIRAEDVEDTSLEEPTSPEEDTNQGAAIRTTEANSEAGSHLMEEVWTIPDREETGEEATTALAEVWEVWEACSRRGMTFTLYVSPPIY